MGSPTKLLPNSRAVTSYVIKDSGEWNSQREQLNRILKDIQGKLLGTIPGSTPTAGPVAEAPILSFTTTDDLVEGAINLYYTEARASAVAAALLAAHLAAPDPHPQYEPVFTKGDIVQGTNVSLSGTLTGRLVGSGNVTVDVLAAPDEWTVVVSTQEMSAGVKYVALITSATDFTLPASPSVGEEFVILNSRDSTGGIDARIVTGVSQHILGLSLGDNVLIAPGELLYLIARTSTTFEILLQGAVGPEGPSGAGALLEVDAVLTYDGSDRLSTVTTSHGTKTFAYDGGGVLQTITGTGAYVNKAFTYDGGGLLTNITVT